MQLAALDVDVEFDIDDPDLSTVLHGLFADLTDVRPPPLDGSRPRVHVRVTGLGPWDIASPAHAARTESLEEAVTHVSTAINLSAVAATPLLAFHAAVLTRTGHTLVIPGASGLGKTTLAAALLLRGWSYVSDESFALDWSDSAIHPYPRPLALSGWSQEALGLRGVGVPGEGEHFVRARELGATLDATAGPATHVAVIERPATPTSSDAAIVDLHPGEALEQLLRSGFTHVRDPVRALRILASTLTSTAVARVTLGAPNRTAAALERWVG